MSIRGAGWPATAGDHGQTTYTENQIHTLLSNIEFRLRDLSNTARRDQQIERINSRIDMIYNKLGLLEVSNSLWVDKLQQLVTEECGSNLVTRRIDKTQQQLEITLEHMETTLQTVQNHQKDLEKEIRKMADRQTELSAEIQSMRKEMGSGFDRHNTSQNTFNKQLQDTVANFTQQSKNTDRSLSTCQCNQNDDPVQSTETVSNKLISTMNNMYNGLKDRSDDLQMLLNELTGSTDKYRRKLDSDRQYVINELLDGFLENVINEMVAIQKQADNELEKKLKEQLKLLVEGQNFFINNCRRIQLNEHQIEEDVIGILKLIFDHIDNKSSADNTTLEEISKSLRSQNKWEEKRFEELSELSKNQSDQLVRTVAYSTNQIMKLHQDMLNITNLLTAANNGSTSALLQVGKNKNNSTHAMAPESKNDHEKTVINKKIAPQPSKVATTLPENINSSTAKFNDTIVYDYF